MLSVLKVNGARSSVDNGAPQRGKKGRVDVFVERGEDGFQLQCVDVGNYGTERHRVQVPLSLDQLRDMIADLSAVAQGRVQTTQLEDEEVEATEVVEEEVQTVSAQGVEEPLASSAAPSAGSETSLANV